jgi:putative proteasome-type protease
MTFCVGIKVREGLVGIADTRVMSGNECITARKVAVYHQNRHAMFLMTSGLRSVRDKALAYFEEFMTQNADPFDRVFKAVNAFAAQVRRVGQEDKEALAASGLSFNMHALVGGQLENDREHKLYLLYPQGNWVEIGEGTPYQIIGATGYGKPVLDRTLKYQDPMRHAFKVGCLAFDSTRISAADVDFPIDVVLYLRDSYRIIEHRYQKDDLLEASTWWQERLRESVSELPSEWIEQAFAQLVSQAEEPGSPPGPSAVPVAQRRVL